MCGNKCPGQSVKGKWHSEREKALATDSEESDFILGFHIKWPWTSKFFPLTLNFFTGNTEKGQGLD